MWPFIFLGCLLTLLGSFIGIVLGYFFKKVARLAKLVFVASLIGMIISIVMGIRQDDWEAQQKGFLDALDLRAAKQAGIAAPAIWKTNREQLEKETQEAKRAADERVKAEQAKAEAERAKAEQEEAEERAKAEHATAEACERDLQCIGNEKSIEAAFACRPWVERMAKNDFQWTDHWYEGKFDRFRWHEKSHDVITYVGDKIKFQNGFGAWVRSKYECDYNFRKKSVADIRVEAGQLPP
jgi:hypothetical protein